MVQFFSLKTFRTLLVLVLMTAAVDGALAQLDRRYQNGTFGFALNLSADLADYRSVTSPEGITLTSPDGLAVVNVFGEWNEAGEPLPAIVAQYKSELPGADFTYEWHARDAVVLSGYQGGDIFYTRIALSPDHSRVAVLNMIYAPEVKRQLDPVVERLSTSLTIR